MSKAVVNIRRMTEDDIENAIDTYTEVFNHPKELKNYMHAYHEYYCFCIDAGLAFVLEEQGVFAGAVIGYERPDLHVGVTAFIEFLGVRRAYQKKGYGKALVEAFVNEAKDRKLRQVSLRTGCFLDAYAMYKKLGFADCRDDSRYMTLDFAADA